MITSNASSSITSVRAFPNYESIGEGSLLTGPKIASAYNIPDSDGAGVKVGIISLGGGFDQTDLDAALADLDLVTGSVTFVPVDGVTNDYTGNPNSADLENILDLICVASLAPQANIVMYKGPGTLGYSTSINSATAYNQTAGMAKTVRRAIDENCDIITISWGSPERIASGGTSFYVGDYLKSILDVAKSKGISVFVATGDYGSIPDINEGSSITTIGPVVGYPASAENVISVGGTTLTLFSGNNQRAGETVSNQYTGSPTAGGSGGISTVVPVPEYQKGLTYQRWWRSNSSAGPITSVDGRGIPDISAAFNTYGINLNGDVYGVYGTSASAPIMAGMMARFISLTGRRPIAGSVHKILYSNLNAYYDILTGNNASYIPKGFIASSNWDPVTGLGVPYGNVLYQMFSSRGLQVKTNANNWSYLSNVKVKTSANTWSNVQAVYTKVDSTTWKQVF